MRDQRSGRDSSIDIETEPIPRDITAEYLSLDYSGREILYKQLEGEPHLHIQIEWDDSNPEMDIYFLRALKGFSDSRTTAQKRTVTIVATAEQKNGDILSKAGNVFAAGVRLE